jgi:hypothetical protein
MTDLLSVERKRWQTRKARDNTKFPGLRPKQIIGQEPQSNRSLRYNFIIVFCKTGQSISSDTGRVCGWGEEGGHRLSNSRFKAAPFMLSAYRFKLTIWKGKKPARSVIGTTRSHNTGRRHGASNALVLSHLRRPTRNGESEKMSSRRYRGRDGHGVEGTG